MKYLFFVFILVVVSFLVFREGQKIAIEPAKSDNESKAVHFKSEQVKDSIVTDKVSYNSIDSGLRSSLQGGNDSSPVFLDSEYLDYTGVQKFLERHKISLIRDKFKKMDRLANHPQTVALMQGLYKGEMISYENSLENRSFYNSLKNTFVFNVNFDVQDQILNGNYFLSVTDPRGVNITKVKGKGNVDFFRYDRLESKGIVFEDMERDQSCFYQFFLSKDGRHMAGQYFCEDTGMDKPLAYFTAVKSQ